MILRANCSLLSDEEFSLFDLRLCVMEWFFSLCKKSSEILLTFENLKNISRSVSIILPTLVTGKKLYFRHNYFA